MAGVLGSLVVTLGLDAATFAAGLTKSEYEARRWRDSITRSSREVGLALAGAAALAATALVAMTKNALESAEAINKLSQKTGIGAESLSELRYAAELSNVSTEALASNLARLARSISEAAQGTGDQATAFRLLGIEVKNADGSLRSADAVLGALAEKFASYADGVEKTALAQAIFGKSGADMIPMLNMGAEGLQRMREEAQALGLVISAETARAAEEFNDTLQKLSKATEGLGLVIARAALPYLQVLADEMLGFVKNADRTRDAVGDLRQVFEGLSVGLNALVFGFASAGRGLGALLAQARLAWEVLRTPPGELIETAKRNWREMSVISDAFKADQQRAWESFEDFNRRIRAAGAAAGAPAGSTTPGTPPRGTPTPSGTKPPAPRMPSASAKATPGTNVFIGIGDADRLLRRQLQGQIDAIRDYAQSLQEGYAFANEYARGVYDQGTIDLAGYLQTQRQLRDEGVKTTVEALDKEIAALRAYRRAASRPDDQAEADNRIAEAIAKREQALTKAARQALLDNQAEAREVQALAERYEDLQQVILRLRGKTAQADALQIGRQVEQARQLSVRAGADPAASEDLRALLGNTSALNQVRDDYLRLLERTRIAEEDIALAAQTAGASELDTLAALKSSRGDALVQMAQLVQKAQELAAALGSPDALLFAEQLAAALRRATAEADPLFTRIRDLSKEMGQAIAGSFEDAIVRGASLRDMLQGIAQDVLRITTRQLITQPLGDLLSSVLQPSVAAVFGGGKAIGGPVEPGKIYRVGERRPEVLTVDGEQFLLMGSSRGRIDPSPELSSLRFGNDGSPSAPPSTSTTTSQPSVMQQPGSVFHVVDKPPELLRNDNRSVLLMGAERGVVDRHDVTGHVVESVQSEFLYDVLPSAARALRVGHEPILLPSWGLDDPEATPDKVATSRQAGREIADVSNMAGQLGTDWLPRQLLPPAVDDILLPVLRDLQGHDFTGESPQRYRQQQAVVRPLSATRQTPGPVVDGPTGGASDVFELLLGSPNGAERRPMLLTLGREQYLFMGDRPGCIDPNPPEEEVEQLLGADIRRQARPKSVGGSVSALGLYRVGEQRPEVLEVRGERFVLAGGQRARPSAASRSESAAMNLTVNVAVPSGTPLQTANQIANTVARKLRVATLRNA